MKGFDPSGDPSAGLIGADGAENAFLLSDDHFLDRRLEVSPTGKSFRVVPCLRARGLVA